MSTYNPEGSKYRLICGVCKKEISVHSYQDGALWAMLWHFVTHPFHKNGLIVTRRIFKV